MGKLYSFTAFNLFLFWKLFNEEEVLSMSLDSVRLIRETLCKICVRQTAKARKERSPIPKDNYQYINYRMKDV